MLNKKDRTRPFTFLTHHVRPKMFMFRTGPENKVSNKTILILLLEILALHLKMGLCIRN